MSRDNDLRVIRTRKSICNAFAELMEKKPFDKISISDIADRAMINRSTFYLHFVDKYDLIAYMAEEMLKEIESSFQGVTPEEMEQAFVEGRPNPQTLRLLEVIEDKHKAMKCIMESKDGFMLYGRIIDAVFSMHENIGRMFDEEDPMYAYRKEAFAASICVSIRKWMDEGMIVPKEDLAAFITDMARKELL